MPSVVSDRHVPTSAKQEVSDSGSLSKAGEGRLRQLTCQLRRVGRDVLDLRSGNGGVGDAGEEEDERDEEEGQREAKETGWSVTHLGRVCGSSTLSAKNQSVIRRWLLGPRNEVPQNEGAS